MMNIMLRDVNGNTLAWAWAHMEPVPGVLEAHVSDSGTLVVTVDIEGEGGE